MTRLAFKSGIVAATVVIGVLFLALMWDVDDDSLMFTVVYRETHLPGLADGFAVVDAGRGLSVRRSNPYAVSRVSVLSPDGRHALVMRTADPQQIAFTIYDIWDNTAVNFGDSPSFIAGWLEGWSPDGRYFLYREDNLLMRFDVRDGTTNILFDELDAVSTARWSPDGRHIAVLNTQELYLISDSETLIKRIDADVGRSRDLLWSRDSSQLAYTSLGTLIRVYDVETSTRRDLVNFSNDLVFLWMWSPDGRWLSAMTPNNAPSFNLIFNIDTETGAVHRVDMARNDVQSLAWSPESDAVAIGTYDNAVGYPLFLADPTGDAVAEIAPDVYFPRWHEDMLYYLDTQGALFRYTGDDAPPATISMNTGHFDTLDDTLIIVWRTNTESRLRLSTLDGSDGRFITPPDYYVTDFRVH